MTKNRFGFSVEEVYAKNGNKPAELVFEVELPDGKYILTATDYSRLAEVGANPEDFAAQVRAVVDEKAIEWARERGPNSALGQAVDLYAETGRNRDHS